MSQRCRCRSNAKKARTTDAAGAGSGSSVDRITALPLELRARIASLLHYRQVVQLSVLSRPWRYIHHHTPVVKIYLYDFLLLGDVYFDEVHSVPGLLDEGSILSARAALLRRAHDASASAVDTLSLAYAVDDRLMRRHADRIVALTGARGIRIYTPYRRHSVPSAWALDLPPAARDLEVTAVDHLAPAVTGPGAAALRKLSLGSVVVREWPPRLPSLRSLDLDSVTVEAPFAPGDWCPLLEELHIFCSRIEHARVDIHLPHLKFVDLDGVDVCPHDRSQPEGPPFGEITIDAPELVELELNTDAGCTADYRSFALRAPKLRLLSWGNQFAERVVIDVGRPGSVRYGEIQLRSVYTREMEFYRKQMMRMLEGLLPDLPRESIAGVAKPYMMLEECDDSDDDDDDEDEKDEKLTCDISDLMRGMCRSVPDEE